MFNIDNDEIKSVFPARVAFRGFDNDSVSKAYAKISDYLKDNIDEIRDEARS